VKNEWKPLHRMALVSAPWPLFNRPSIQLGTLKAYLTSRFPGLRVESHHFYLKVADAVGFERYQAVSERSWLAETVYGALLFPQMHDSVERLFLREAKGKSVFRGVRFDDLVERARAITQTFIEETEWEDCGLTGFSVCLCQLTASLYLIRRIKELHPGMHVVAGGSSWNVDSCPAWFHHFPEIDTIIVGEGERRIDQKLLDDVSRELGKPGGLRLSSERRRIDGGFILRSGRTETNCALDTILRDARERLETEVAGILFGR